MRVRNSTAMETQGLVGARGSREVPRGDALHLRSVLALHRGRRPARARRPGDRRGDRGSRRPDPGVARIARRPGATRRPAPRSIPRRADFTPDQAFFIAFAHSWASAIRPQQAEELVTTDPHPPADDRTNATLANSPEFQRAFAITAPDPWSRRTAASSGEAGYLMRFESSRSFSLSRSRTGGERLEALFRGARPERRIGSRKTA